MARPKKPDDQLKAPRRLKTPDGKPLLPKGRPPKAGVTVQLPVSELKQMLGATPPLPPIPDAEVEMTSFTPLEYALYVMNDPRQPAERRDRLAVAAMPFVHVKQGEGGKRDKAAEKAEKLSVGKFAAAPAPLRAVK